MLHFGVWSNANQRSLKLQDPPGRPGKPFGYRNRRNGTGKRIRTTGQRTGNNSHPQGERYAPRLTIDQHFVDQKKQITGNMPRHSLLGFQLPGQLSNLRWQSSPRMDPTGDEIEVEVHATGLNFRDIMYTLGLLPDEAIENGFAGPTLGLEFSGIVQSVGNSAQAFTPGDKVVGFGPSSFSNRVVTKASAISHIPSGISFEAAATIPSTFFTAYYSLHHLARLQAWRKSAHPRCGRRGWISCHTACQMDWCRNLCHCRIDEKRDFLRLLGVDHIYNSRSLSFADEILAAD